MQINLPPPLLEPLYMHTLSLSVTLFFFFLRPPSLIFPLGAEPYDGHSARLTIRLNRRREALNTIQTQCQLPACPLYYYRHYSYYYQFYIQAMLIIIFELQLIGNF